MAMEIGTVGATTGLTRDIYERIDAYLAPPFQEAPDNEDALEAAREGWRQLAHAIAEGVITHLRANLDIIDVRTQGDVTVASSGFTGPADPSAHTHAVGIDNGDLVGEFEQVVGTGAVQ